MSPIQQYLGSGKNVELIPKKKWVEGGGVKKPVGQNTHVVKAQMKHIFLLHLASFKTA
jgi:hypothetical protein